MLLGLSVIFASCLDDIRSDEFTDNELSETITVNITIPEGYNYSVEGLTVLLYDNTAGLEYSGITNASGVAEIRVAPGYYTASTEVSYRDSGGILYLFNGMSARIDAVTGSKNVDIELLVSKSGQIVIKELYFGGCYNDEIGRNYTNDQYIMLYNNSDMDAYIDSLCIGVVYPFNAPTSGKVSDWVKPGTTELRDSIPAASMVFMFPGSGKDNILKPGEELVVSLNAINHTADVLASVNLGKPGYWALYDPIMTPRHATPEAGVRLLNGIWKTGSANSYVLSVTSPGVFIFTLGGKSVEQYVLDNFSLNPNSTNVNLAGLLVDKVLIMDAIECLRNPTDSKRFPPDIDNGYAMISGTGQGQSVIRKIDAEETKKAGGRIVYMDTNNSSNDFEVLARPTLFNQ